MVSLSNHERSHFDKLSANGPYLKSNQKPRYLSNCTNHEPFSTFSSHKTCFFPQNVLFLENPGQTT